MRFRSVLAWVPVAMLFVACGSDESEGDGTGGKTTCAAGATQACTCSGSDTGVQVCAADGKSWGACACGGSGGSGGGSGGAAGSGNAGGSGGVGGGSGGGTGGSAGADSGTNWQDAPCPVNGQPIYFGAYMDCTEACPIFNAQVGVSCEIATCTQAPALAPQGVGKGQMPMLVRLPSKPGIDPACVSACGPNNTVFGVGVTAGFTNSPLKVTVPAPWKVRLTPATNGMPQYYCFDGTEAAECAVSNDGLVTVVFLTNDPNAPAVNALIEFVGEAGTCR
jgi:hypothetical protein